MFEIFKNNCIQFLDELFTWLVQGLVISSYQLCLVAGIVGLILFIFGWKKCRNIPFLSYAIYLLIQLLGRVLIGA